MEEKSGVTRSVIDEIRSLGIRGHQMDGECGATRSIVGELHCCDSQGDQ